MNKYIQGRNGSNVISYPIHVVYIGKDESEKFGSTADYVTFHLFKQGLRTKMYNFRSFFFILCLTSKFSEMQLSRDEMNARQN